MYKCIVRDFWKAIATTSITCLASCSSRHLHKTVMNEDVSYRSFYDERTLAIRSDSILMPYNRLVDPAGTVVRFGNPSQENHSLDCVLLPGEKVLAVEDRYGLALFDIEQKKLLYHLDYEGEYKGVKSTFSGIKVWQDGNTVHIFWGAANPTSKPRSSWMPFGTGEGQ